MDDLRVLARFLDVDETVVVRMRHEPEPAAARLLVSLGCGWIVDVDADRCAQRCGRKECAVSIDERRGPASPRQRPLVHAGQIKPVPMRGAPDWEPNWIDYRHSLVQVLKRVEADDETLEICPHCECEVDVTPAPHRPNCRGIGGARASSAASVSERSRKDLSQSKPAAVVPVAPEGLDLLDAMDAGERLPHAPLEEADSERLGPDGSASSSDDELEHDDEPTEEGEPEHRVSEPPAAAEDGGRQSVPGSPPESVLGEEAAVGDLAVSGSAALRIAGEPERAATSPSTATGKRVYTHWTRALMIERLQTIAAELGHTPTANWLRGHKQAALADVGTLRRHQFASYTALVDAAGLEPVTKASVVRRPPSPDSGRVAFWTRERIVELLQAENERMQRPPTALEWREKGDGRPTEAQVRKVFGSWNAALEAAGLEVLARGATLARKQIGWIKVNGTGLAYRNTTDAYVAADEIEADGERVAAAAREDGNDGKADQAVDASRELAEKIRAAARAADERAGVEIVSNDSSREGAATDLSARGHARPVDERERDDQQPELRAPSPAATDAAAEAGREPKAGRTEAPASPQAPVTEAATGDPPSRSGGAALELREAAPSRGTPLTQFLAKLPREELEESIDEYRNAIAVLEFELDIVQRALTAKDAA